jgi:hypothetical protein
MVVELTSNSAFAASFFGYETSLPSWPRIHLPGFNLEAVAPAPPKRLFAVDQSLEHALRRGSDLDFGSDRIFSGGHGRIWHSDLPIR